MAECNFCEMKSRRLLRVGGGEAQAFLQNIITGNVELITADKAGFSGLLSPQGKILFDFFILRDGDGFLLDVAEGLVDGLLRRLTFYRLRADVTLELLDGEMRVFSIWGERTIETLHGTLVADPRLEAMGWRYYGDSAPESAVETDITAYHAHRIALGMPEGGVDYAYGGTFPHDALYDQIGAVDFAKGCYVGQEVISRVHHRATARKRVLMVNSELPLPEAGTAILAGGKNAGELKSVSGNIGLAMVRIDRVGAALQAGEAVLAGEQAIEVKIADWATFDWPEIK